MKTKIKPVTPHHEYLVCDDCDDRMVFKGTKYFGFAGLTMPKVKYVYNCPACKKATLTDEKYPKLIYR